ncbi:MAG: SpoIIE family protein phosphatase [Phycisphaerae bacterium]|nr:SpoIIE family protein phosphatase [Phycisphaerae bacterium]
MPTLRFVDDGGQLQVRTLDSERFVIGRAAGSQIIFDDDMISREHVAIEIDRDGRFRIRDLGSRNKTYVNGELIAETLLSPGDVIRVGDRIVEYLDETGTEERFDPECLTPDKTEPPNCEWLRSKAPVSLTLAQVSQLALLGADLPLSSRAEDIAQGSIGQVLLDLQAERGFIALRGDAKTELLPLAHRALKRPSGGSLTPVSQWFVFAPLLQSVAGRYPQTASQINPKLGFAATAVTAPLLHRGEVIGVIYADRPQSKKPFPATALPYAMAAGAHLGMMIGETARKLTRTAVREGASWMGVIRRIQGSLSPPVSSSESFEVATRRFPGRARCGDLVEVVHLDEQHCCVLVVDAGGHGMHGLMQAASMIAALRTALSVAEDAYFDPAAMFNELNRSIAAAPARQIVPCTFIAADISAGKLIYINAGGMAPLLMVAPGRLITLDEPSLILGVDPEYVFEPTRVDLPEAFRVVCHTDGLIEASSVGGEPLGESRLHEALLDRNAFNSVVDTSAALERLWSAHMAGGQGDDDALFVVLGRG